MTAATWRRVNLVLHEIRASESELASRFEVTHAFAIEAIDRVAELVAHAGAELRVFLDDGDLTHYDFTVELAARRIGVSLALVTSALDTPGFLATRQAHELAALPGVELLSHGVTHTALAGEAGPSRGDVEHQLAASRSALAALGIETREFVYPYGIHSPEVVAMTGAVYAGAYTCDHGVEDGETPPLMKPRIVLERRRSPAEWREIVAEVVSAHGAGRG